MTPSSTNEQGDDGGETRYRELRIGIDGGAVAFDQLLLGGERPEAGRQSPHDQQIGGEQGKEQHAEQEAQEDLRPEDAPEDPGEMDFAEPQEVDEEAREGRQDDPNPDHHSDGDDQPPAPDPSR